MNRWMSSLRTRKAAFPILCGVGTVLLAAGLMGGGIIDPAHTALIVLAIYIGSKIVMGGIVVWLLFRHSPLIRGFLGRFTNRP